MLDLSKNLSYVNNNFSHGSFDRHFHEEYSIGYIYKGTHKFANEDGKFDIPQGIIRVINPYEFHTTYDSSWSYVNFMPTINLINSIASDIYQEEMKDFFVFNSIIDDPYAIKLLTDLNYILEHLNEEKLLIDSAVIEFFDYIIKYFAMRYKKRELQITAQKKNFHLVFEYINEFYSLREIRLEDLASVAGISKYHFLREFKKYMKLSPYRYIQIKRINLAKKLFNKGIPASQIALECGFTDQTHMIKVFKKYFGYTPSKLKKKNISCFNK